MFGPGQAEAPCEQRPGQLHRWQPRRPPRARATCPWLPSCLGAGEDAHEPLLLISTGCQFDALHSAPKEVPTCK